MVLYHGRGSRIVRYRCCKRRDESARAVASRAGCKLVEKEEVDANELAFSHVKVFLIR
jgi:hypothetical protein